MADRCMPAALRPLYFGSDQDGTLLGYVVERCLHRAHRADKSVSLLGSKRRFLSGGQIVASTLAQDVQASLAKQSSLLSGTSRGACAVKLGNAQFLSATEDLSATATSPLQLVVLKSFEPAERSISRIDRMVLVAGLLALLSGTMLMIVISRLVTRPLEDLSRVSGRLALAMSNTVCRGMAPRKCGN